MPSLDERITNFYQNTFLPNQKRYAELAQGQAPTILYLGCSDSRVNPHDILQASPGEVFVLRNAGNMIATGESGLGVAATLEFALSALPIKDVVICGHSSCGAVSGALKGPSANDGALGKWLTQLPLPSDLPPSQDWQEKTKRAAQANVLSQIENFLSLPVVAENQSRNLRVHGWYFDIGTGVVEAYDGKTQKFHPANGPTRSEALPVAADVKAD